MLIDTNTNTNTNTLEPPTGALTKLTATGVEGFLRNPACPTEPQIVEILVDDQPIGTAVADHFDIALLKRNLGSGMCAFRFRLACIPGGPGPFKISGRDMVTKTPLHGEFILDIAQISALIKAKSKHQEITNEVINSLFDEVEKVKATQSAQAQALALLNQRVDELTESLKQANQSILMSVSHRVESIMAVYIRGIEDYLDRLRELGVREFPELPIHSDRKQSTDGEIRIYAMGQDFEGLGWHAEEGTATGQPRRGMGKEGRLLVDFIGLKGDVLIVAEGIAHIGSSLREGLQVYLDQTKLDFELEFHDAPSRWRIKAHVPRSLVLTMSFPFLRFIAPGARQVGQDIRFLSLCFREIRIGPLGLMLVEKEKQKQKGKVGDEGTASLAVEAGRDGPREPESSVKKEKQKGKDGGVVAAKGQPGEIVSMADSQPPAPTLTEAMPGESPMTAAKGNPVAHMDKA